MIKLKDGTRKDKDGNIVDDSIYMGRYDSRNMIIFKLGTIDKRTGKKNKAILGYYSSISTLLEHSLDFLIKDSPETQEVYQMKNMIADHIANIKKVMKDCPSMLKMMKEKPE